MEKIRRFLGFFALLFVALFVGDAWSAGYICPDYKKYNWCNEGFYMVASSDSTACAPTPAVGNACRACPTGQNCIGGTICPTVTITYNLNGGNGTTPDSTSCPAGEPCDLNDGETNSFYRAGYVLVGWSTNKTASTGDFTLAANYTNTHRTVYAVWKPCTGARYKPSTAQAVDACRLCPVATRGWTGGKGTAWTSYSQCYETRNATAISSYCSAGQLARNASGPNSWDVNNTRESGAFSARPGSYVTGSGANMTCAQCSGAKYSAGGDVHFCTDCPVATSGWTRGTGTGWTSYSQCYETRDATAISSYCSAGQLARNASGPNSWDVNNTRESGAFSARPGSYVTGSGANMTCAQCSGAKYSAGGDVHSCTDCISPTAGWTLGTGVGWTSYSQCYQMRNATDISEYCTDGQLIQYANSTTAWDVNGTQANKGFRASAGSFVSGTGADTTCKQCAVGAYSPGGNVTSCTACQDGTTTSDTGQTSCNAECENKTDLVTDWQDAIWSPNKTDNMCLISGCDTGYHPSDDGRSCEPDEYIITLKKNGGSGTVNGSTGTNDAVQLCKHGEMCNLPSSGITRNGYAFTGWGDSSGCTSGVYQKVFTGTGTMYACWSQQTTQCQAGKYYNGSSHVDCPSGSYCPGTGNANIGQAGCSVSCPSGADGSDTGATSASGCYKTCGGKTISGGTATVVNSKVYYSGSAYPACTYHVTCNEGYRATNQDTAAATCTPCEDGQVCPGGDGTDDPDDCPPGSYCEGGIEHECPVGGTSDAGAGAITDCYRVCEPTLDIDNGQGISTGNKYYNGNAYPACTYRAECDENYVPQNSPSENPSCVWGDADECPEDHYCPPDGTGPIACPDGGKAERGSTSITQCYKIFIDYEKFLHGKADVKCNYQTSTKQYDYCNVIQPVKSCDAGYYYNSGMMCSSTESGYYSPDGDITQTACPVNPTGGAVASTENADSYTDCYMACEIDIPNSSSIAAENNTVYGISADEYAACSFAVTCNTGYTVENNNTDAPSCVANEYTITLDKNGGTGSVADSIQCTFDSGDCDLPAVSGLNRPGYTVVEKWCSDANGGTPCYDAGTSVATNISATGRDTTLYAVWNPNVYTVNLNHNDADVDGAPETVYLKYANGWFSNADATTPIVNMTTLPELTSYEFAGYYSMNSGGIQLISTNGEFQTNENALTFTTTNPATIYARWSAGTTNCAAGTYYSGTGSECLQCTANNYCPGGDFATDSGTPEGLYACPNQGLSTTGADAITDCYKTKLEYNATHGDGTQTCSYNSDDSAYTANCTDRVIDACDAGYWLADADAEAPDCDPVGNGYYSGDETIERTACPNGGDTESDTSTMVQQCFKTELPYEAIYGSGTQRCFYSSGDAADAIYQRDCDTKVINSCRGGYYLESPDDTDCTIVTKGYYSDPGDTNRYQCPAGGTTYEENAESIRRCNKDGQPYTDALHGAGEKTCFYTSGEGDDAIYSSECENITMTSCDAGYYYNAQQTTTDCVEVGLNYYSPAVSMSRNECPAGGKTDGTTSASASECYREDMACDVANGSGEQTCNYNESDSAYTLNCQTCNVTMCDEGYSQVGNECINCPAGSVCEDGQQKTCSELTGGEYPMSDAGTTDVAMCYKECDIADNAAAMTGRDYYQGADTCEIARCEAGYTFDNDECAECPAGSFCDGGMPGDDAHACADLGDGDWEYSAPGATDESGCYQICKEYDITNGTAIPISEQAFYPNECEYRGESDTGNPCEIVDGVCVEISCKPEYEIKNGVCVPCARDYALTYETEGNCRVATCELGYHPNGDQCENNIRQCNITNAIYAEQEWDFKRGAFGACIVKECDYGYHIASNACVTDTQPCVVENGTGYQEWDARAGKWGECVATYCEPGYTNDPSESNEPTKQCGECRNKYSVLGQQAVAASTYIQGCEIGACLYQGELYNLENNECVPICPMEEYEDETGTMIWDDSRKKCVRTCKEGYTMW